jgi:hypothetical protein
LGVVSHFGAVGVFFFTSDAGTAAGAAAAIIGTSTGLDNAGTPALFPPELLPSASDLCG